MGNKHRGRVLITLGQGSTKYIRYTTNALVELEEILGTSAAQIFADADTIQANMGFKTMRAFIWAGLQGAGSRFSIADVGDLLEPRQFGYYFEKISEAFAAAMGVSTDAAEAEADPLDPTDAPPATHEAAPTLAPDPGIGGA